jgi:glycosyltransferase involved in cell wall biosynthesis
VLVSILIPAFNAERWIADTIRSALAQTWPTKEIIVVDDGSSDRTRVVARQFASSNVKVVEQSHQGASAARNRALACAQGDYVQWLDADDLLARTKIEAQLNAVREQNRPLTLLSSAFGIFYWRPRKARFNRTSIWCDLEPIEYLLRSFSLNLWMSPLAWLVSRELTNRAGPWNERLTLNDDGEYFCRVVAASETVQFVPNALGYYRQSGSGQLSRTCDRRALESFALSVSLSADHLLALEDSDRTRKATLLFLQLAARWFVPHNLDLIEAVARKLGGEVSIPPDDMKTRAFKALFGQDLGAKVLDSGRKAKFAAAVKWDHFLYRLNPVPPL